MVYDEKVKVLSQRLIDGVQQTFQSDHFKEYLKVVSTFHTYSPRNTTLIFLQRPAASRVAGFQAWKKYGRYVRRGETGISIFAPSKVVVKLNKPLLDGNGNPVLDENGNPQAEKTEKTRIQFRIVSVFDVSQTDGEPLPALCSELQGAVPDFQTIFNAVQKISPYKIVFENMSDDQKGCCRYGDQTIALRPGMSDEQIVKTLIHEVAHATLHSDTKKSKQEREVEAESIAFIVSDFLGIDTSSYSFDYVSSWSYGMGPSQLQDVLENIQHSANEIICKVQSAMESLEKAPERNPQKLPERLSEAVKKSEMLRSEKEMIPSAKLLAQ